jgi:hypothetical protein
MSKIIILSDTHLPYEHPRAFAFIHACLKKYNPDRIVHIGDCIDNSQISFHEKDPDSMFSPSSELKEAILHMHELYKMMPVVDVLDSNHGSLVYRRSKAFGIPRFTLRPWNEIIEAPVGWKWHRDLIIDDIYFHHGDITGKLQKLVMMDKNIVIGHRHTEFKIEYFKSKSNLRWGMQVGCLIDENNLAFNYARNNLARPILGVGLIVDGIPFLIPMHKQVRGDHEEIQIS